MSGDVAESAQIEGGILVGHDGSEHAQHALRWAGELARRSDMDLHVLRAWSMTSAPRPATWSPGYVPPMTDYEQAVLDAQEGAVHGTVGVAVTQVGGRRDRAVGEA